MLVDNVQISSVSVSSLLRNLPWLIPKLNGLESEVIQSVTTALVPPPWLAAQVIQSANDLVIPWTVNNKLPGSTPVTLAQTSDYNTLLPTNKQFKLTLGYHDNNKFSNNYTATTVNTKIFDIDMREGLAALNITQGANLD